MGSREFQDVLIIFAAFLASVFLFIFLKKIYYRIFFKKRYYIFPKLSTKGIANIAMVIAIAIAIILLLTIASAGLMGVLFRAYPGWRINIESILIKIGGLLFGPVVGMFVGLCTDLLTVALTAGMFHYGYCLAAIFFGLFSGIICSIRRMCKNKQTTFYISMFLFLLVTFTIQFFYINFIVNRTNFPLTLSFLGVNLQFNLWIVNIFTMLLLIFTSVIMWVGVGTNNRYTIAINIRILFGNVGFYFRKKYFSSCFKTNKFTQQSSDKYIKWQIKIIDRYVKNQIKITKLRVVSDKKKSNWSIDFVSVFVCIMVGELLIGTMLVPIFDVQFSAMPLDYWLALRMITVVPSAILNFLVLYPVFKIVVPSMHYSYLDDSVEDIKTPLIINN